MADDFYFADVDRTQRGLGQLQQGMESGANRAQQARQFMLQQRLRQQEFERQGSEKAFGLVQQGADPSAAASIEGVDDQSRFQGTPAQGTTAPSVTGTDVPSQEQLETGGFQTPKPFTPAQASKPGVAGAMATAAGGMRERQLGSARLQQLRDSTKQALSDFTSRSMWGQRADPVTEQQNVNMLAQINAELAGKTTLTPEEAADYGARVGSLKGLDLEAVKRSQLGRTGGRSAVDQIKVYEARTVMQRYLNATSSQDRAYWGSRLEQLKKAGDPVFGDPDEASVLLQGFQSTDPETVDITLKKMESIRRGSVLGGDAAQPGEAASGRNMPSAEAVPGTGQRSQHRPFAPSLAPRRGESAAQWAARARAAGLPIEKARQMGQAAGLQ